MPAPLDLTTLATSSKTSRIRRLLGVFFGTGLVSKDRTGRSAFIFLGMTLGLAGCAAIRAFLPSVGTLGTFSWGTVTMAIGTILTHEFWFWRLKHLEASPHPVDRERFRRVQFQDDQAEVNGLEVESETACKLKLQILREHRARLLQERERGLQPALEPKSNLLAGKLNGHRRRRKPHLKVRRQASKAGDSEPDPRH